MLKKFRLSTLSILAALFIGVAQMGIKPASFFVLYQPELPE